MQKSQNYEFDYENVYYKIMANNMIHSKYRFKIGLNILSCNDPWDGRDCAGGGFYFCNLSDVPEWLHLYPNGIVCEIRISHDAIVCKQPNKFKSSEIIVSNPIKYQDFIEKYELESLVIKQNGMYLCYIKNLTQTICIDAVKRCVNAFKYVDENNQTIELCDKVIKKNGLLLEFVKNKTYQLCLDAVKQNGIALKYVPQIHHNYDIYVIAIKNNALALKFTFLLPLTNHQCNQLFDLAIEYTIDKSKQSTTGNF